MIRYGDINDGTEEGQRTLARLDALRRSLSSQIPPRADDLLLLATWNIREFDSAAYGARGSEPLHYIAEIINRFDIVAVTEVRSNLIAFGKLMALLGDEWHHIVTDTTDGRAGNRERIAVVYDTRKVTFGGLAGELILPPVDTVVDGKKVSVPAAQFARTPLLAGFNSRWVDFMLSVFHVVWGDRPEEREAELAQLSHALMAKAEDRNSWSPNLIVLGDFNIGSPTDVAWKKLRDADWKIPPDFVSDIKGTSIDQKKFYDQIAVREVEDKFELARIDGRPSAGAFNFFDTVYRPRADFETYRSTMASYKANRRRSNFEFDARGKQRSPDQQERWYRSYWRTHQMSDHLPLWVAIRTDYTDPHIRDRIKAVTG